MLGERGDSSSLKVSFNPNDSVKNQYSGSRALGERTEDRTTQRQGSSRRKANDTEIKMRGEH